MRVTILALFLIGNAIGARASDLEDLARDGYAVVEETQVDGDFEGCEFDKQIQLVNGLVFVCAEYSYSYGFMSEVLILKHIRSGEIKVLIDDQAYNGALYTR